MNYNNLDELAKQVGGPLRLTQLVISRSRQIIKKAPVLVETKLDDPVRLAFLEIMQRKVKLNDENVRHVQASELKSSKKELALE